MKFGRGLKRSSPHRIAHRLGAHQHPKIAAALAAGPKGGASLPTTPVMSQGNSSCCHSHSGAAGVWSAFAAAGKPLPFVPSPRQIASCTYADIRARSTPSASALSPLTDSGAELQDDADAMRNWGVSPIAAPTADGRYSDVENDQNGVPFPEPDVVQLEQAATNLIDGEYAITVDGSAPRTVAACLDAGVPVWVGFYCDSAVENLQAGQIMGVPNESDPNGGGHAVLIVGYRTNAAGKLEYRTQNSWGSDYCDGGFFWVSESFVMSCWDLMPLAVAA